MKSKLKNSALPKGFILDAAAKRRVNRVVAACEAVETVVARNGAEFVPDDGTQMPDADRVALAADVRAQVGHIFAESRALMDLTDRYVAMNPVALFHHLRRVQAAAEAGLKLIGAKL